MLTTKLFLWPLGQARGQKLTNLFWKNKNENWKASQSYAAREAEFYIKLIDLQDQQNPWHLRHLQDTTYYGIALIF